MFIFLINWTVKNFDKLVINGLLYAFPVCLVPPAKLIPYNNCLSTANLD